MSTTLTVQRDHGSGRAAWATALRRECGLILVLVGAFVATYAAVYGFPISFAPYHLQRLIAFWAPMLMIRGILAVVAPSSVAREISVCLVALFVAALGAYYLLVLIGLEGWARVITYPVILAYASQIGPLLESLQISPLVAGTAVFVSIALIWAAVRWWVLPTGDWVMAAFGTAARPLQLTALLVIAAVPPLTFHELSIEPRGPVAVEPLAITFFPSTAILSGQSNRLGPSPALREQEDSAREQYRPTGAENPRNVVVIVGDALRPDRMGLYGYHRGTTPNIEAFLLQAADHVVVESAWAVCPESYCGLVATAQSRYVDDFVEKGITLQETLKLNGYRAGMILSGDHVNFYGLRDVYGELDFFVDGGAFQGYMNDDTALIPHVEALDDWDGRPTFIQFHLMSSHTLGARHERYMRFMPASNYRGLALGAIDVERANNHYDNGVAQFDAMAGAIVEILRRKGYLDNAILVLKADHGESLGEHGEWAHAKSLFPAALRIPLVFAFFGERPREPLRGAADSPVSQIDVAPTVAREVGVPIPLSWKGRALQGDHRRTHLRVQQATARGLIELSGSHKHWLYWVDMRNGRRFAAHIRDADADRTETLPRETIDEWTVRAMLRD